MTATFRKRQARTGWLMVLPALMGFLIFVVYPIGTVIRDSFTSYNPLSGDSAFIGSDNYARLVTDETALIVAKNTFIFALLLVPINMILALTLASILN